MEKTLELTFPILEVTDDIIVSKTGDCTVAYELTKPEIFTLSSEDLDVIHQAWVRAIGLLTAPSICHLQDWFFESTYQTDLENIADSELGRASERHFHERPYLEHKAYLFLTRMPAGRKPAGPGLSSLLQRNLVPEECLDPAIVQEFLDQAGRFERILTGSGLIRCRRLSTVELTGDERHTGVIEQYCILSAPEDNNRPLLVRDIVFRDGLQIGEFKGVLYTLADAAHLPSRCGIGMRYTPYSTERTSLSIGFATALGPLLPYNHVYNQYVFVEDIKVITGKMELRRRRLQSLSAHSRENALTRQAVDDHLNEAISGQKQMVKAHFNVFAWTDEPEKIKEIRKDTSAAIAQMGAHPHPETVSAPQIWWAGIPGNASDLPINERFSTFAEQAVCLLLPETNYRSSISPFGIRLGDRITGNPVHVDISDEPMRTGWITNRNKFVLGGSGSGKSFFTNHLLRSYYEQGAHIVVVDIGNSYQGLCNLLEGQYFAYTETDAIRFNPFWLPDGGAFDVEKRESIKTLLLALWKKEDEAFLRSEYVALSNALQQYYEKLGLRKDIFPCFDSFYEFLADEFAEKLDGERVKSRDFDLDNFLYVLRPFYKGGEYDYLLNATEELDLLQQRFIVFELDLLKDHPILFPVVTIVIMEVFIGKMRKLPGVRKVILIEECWKAITRQGMSEYLRYLFKTVRKFYGEAIVVTQELEDIISSPVVKQAILNNADCRILLDQSKFQNKFDAIQDLLGLSEKDKSLVLSLNKSMETGRKYKEVFIGLGSGHSKVYRTEVSIEEYLCYTTEASEKLLVQQYAEQYGGMRKGIAKLAAEWREKH
ncbi:MAG: TraG family conjugative transposon ATPase [Chitinophagaceae bacterium]|nr:TraG family conjugative transposon ATPase [Chitinophagaceae bacterium]